LGLPVLAFALPTIAALARDLAAGRTSSVALVESALARIEDRSGEGRRAFLHVDGDKALAQAHASDTLRRHGITPSPLAGLPISIKDLFDVAGEVTRAGSVVLDNQPAAPADAKAVARLRAAGAILIGRTNMTEFAYSGLGLNPHYGTPGNPFDRARIPGGSSSGGAVSVADGMAVAALGTDTGGSVRIPSSFCALTGFKPTAARVPLDGTVPLSPSLDSIGPLAPSVACCALLDAIVAAEPPDVPAALPITGLRFGIPQHLVLDDLDPITSGSFSESLRLLSAAGARVFDIPFDELAELPKINAAGGLPAPEAFAWHRELLIEKASLYDPRVLARIQRGEAVSAADYLDLQRRRAEIIRTAARTSAPFDALVMPAVAITAPRFDELVADGDYARVNALVLRNTSVANFLDRCAISLPAAPAATLPVGLMLMGERGGDRRLLQVAAAVEAVLRRG
jgi:aspartyl-tRNA(Asn)/glutamyl-tRNA(Gln) amidotransferase subunit A